MRPYLLALSIVFVLVSCSSKEVQIDVKESENHYRLGVELAQYSLYQNSLEEFDLAIKLDPNNLKALRKKGLVLFGMKRYDEAGKMFEQAIALAPEDTQSHLNLGMVHYATGNKDAALKAWEHAVGLHENDNDAKAYNNIGNIYKERNQFEQAIAYYQKARAQDPANSMFRNNLADSYRRLGQFDKAEKMLLQSLKDHKDGMLTHFNLGMVYVDQKKYSEAVNSFQKSLQVNPYYPEAWYQIASAELARNNRASARQSIEKALQADPNNSRYQELYGQIRSS